MPQVSVERLRMHSLSSQERSSGSWLLTMFVVSEWICQRIFTFSFFFFCRTVNLILSSKVLCRHTQHVFQRNHVTVFLQDCIPSRESLSTPNCLLCHMKILGFSMKIETEKRVYLTWVINSKGSPMTVLTKWTISVTRQMSWASTFLKLVFSDIVALKVQW